jgi:hypothetical protein
MDCATFWAFFEAYWVTFWAIFEAYWATFWSIFEAYVLGALFHT